MQRTAVNLVSKQIRGIAGNTNKVSVKHASSAASVVLPEKIHSVNQAKSDGKAEEVFSETGGLSPRGARSSRNNNAKIVEAKGSWLIDSHGSRLLDMTGGGGSLPTGHAHPKVVSSATTQMKLLLEQSSATDSCAGLKTMHPPTAEQAARLQTDVQAEFLRRFLELTPGGRGGVRKHDGVLFTNSSYDATQQALKAAVKLSGGRSAVVGVNTSESTTSAVSAAAGRTMHASFSAGSVAAFDEALARAGGSQNIAAVVVEPVDTDSLKQVSEDTMRHIRSVCDANKISLVFDESRCGAGRCTNGKSFWAHELVGVDPDMLIFDNQVASGLPLGGVSAPKDVFDEAGVDLSKSTGPALSLAAASATLDVIAEERLLENGVAMAKVIAKELSGMPYMSKVVHQGAMVTATVEGGHRVEEIVRDAAIEHGLILQACGKSPADGAVGASATSLRVAPPLNVSAKEVEVFADRLYAVMKNLPLSTGSAV